MRRWQIFFLVAGLFNLAGGLTGFFTMVETLDPPATYPFAFHLLFLAVAILGIGYLMVARDPRQNRAVVWIGLLTKIAGLGMSYWAIYDGQMPASTWPQPLVADLPWAIGFALFLVTTRSPEGAVDAPSA